MTGQMLTAHVTFLEMTKQPSRRYPAPLGPQLALHAARNIPPAYYRFLYREVGKPHHWYVRRDMDDAELDALINAPTAHIFVPMVEGCPAGFFELESSDLPGEVEIIYFGLMPRYVGMGLGKWLLSAAIDAAWALKPQKITLNTNTLDHPRALQLYQKLGFEPVGTGVDEIEPWV